MLVGRPRPAHQHAVGSQACGLSFSISRSAKRPHSLGCILAELRRDQRIDPPRGATLDSQLANSTLGIGMYSNAGCIAISR
jgi:uracil DNA glycosylase